MDEVKFAQRSTNHCLKKEIGAQPMCTKGFYPKRLANQPTNLRFKSQETCYVSFVWHSNNREIHFRSNNKNDILFAAKLKMRTILSTRTHCRLIHIRLIHIIRRPEWLIHSITSNHLHNINIIISHYFKLLLI